MCVCVCVCVHTWAHVCVHLCVALACFLSAWQKLQLSRKRCLNWENASIRLNYGQACEAFWLMINDWLVNVGEPCPLKAVPSLWAGGPGCYKKASWESHEEQASKHFSTASVLVPTSRLPALTSLDDGLQAIRKSFLPKLLWAIVCYHSNRNPN